MKAQCARYRQHGKPWHRPRLQNLDDYDIVRVYGAEYRGVVNYYLLAQDVWRLRTLRWHAETSMLKTLAAKHKSTVTKMAARHQAKVITGDGPRTCYEARRRRKGKPDLVARFGGIILRQDRRAVITDPAPVPVRVPRTELLVPAPQAGVRAMRDRHHGGSPPGHRPQRTRETGRASPRGPPSWQGCGARRSSSARRAMTGSTRTRSRTRHKSPESRMPGKRARPVRREAARKRPGFIQHEHGTSPGSPPYQE